MGLINKKPSLKQQMDVKRKLRYVSMLGCIFLLLPIILILTDPMFIIAKYKFRLENGSILHELLSSEMEGGHFEVFLFNITNAERFLSGDDHKLKLEEVGPFTYLEYRTHSKLVLDSKLGVMRYIPKLRSEFVVEKSIAHPKEIPVTMPNIPMLSATSMMRSSPYFVRSLFNTVARQVGSKPIVTMDADKYLWGYKDPVLTFANTIVPGLIHFNTTGIMDRLYDKNTEYLMELGATDDDKFRIKTVTKYRRIAVGGAEDIAESTASYNDTYEGMAYPPMISTTTPINIFRLGMCKTFEMDLCGRKTSEYGPNAFVYKFSDRMFLNNNLCNDEESCPDGIMDMSSCFYGLPLGLSKGHFLDADPRVLDRIEGLNPNKEEHSSHLVIEPKIGLTLETSWSIQVNIIMGNIDYNTEASKFSNMVLPIAHFKIKQPQLPAIAITALRMMYITVPFVIFWVDIILVVTGLCLMLYAAWLFYHHYYNRNDNVINISIIDVKVLEKSEIPLIEKLLDQ